MRNPVLLAAFLCSACNVTVTDANESRPAQEAGQSGNDAATQAAIKNAAYDFEIVQEQNPKQPNRILMAQVALDRWGFSPGVLDGKDGMSYKAALRGFQEAHDLPVTGLFDQPTSNMLLEGEARPTTYLVKIPEDFARGPFFNIPRGLNEQASLPALTYRNLMEKLAERFHTTPDALVALNSPTTQVGAGATIRVPAIDNQPVAQIAPLSRLGHQTPIAP